ncbi:hypothetical protein [Streptomyces sp.]|uniref:hypothetical protein n=1 Tax=Streptomyces sp. TaxID=1931 RepID=UPI002D7A0018|nr:hypothetical protein [Streptomyces sp.]HET6355999.1 hypothetical protein [Streptomyces sp.]
MTTSQNLRSIALTWTDLRDALGAPAIIGGLGQGLRGYLAALEQHDATEAAALRALERDPAQIGARPVPISLRVYDTMRAIEAALAECADQTAAAVQNQPTPFAPSSWPAADRARRDTIARADLADPRRWRFRGTTPPAPYTALWLLARVERRPGPFRRLTEAQERHIGNVARESVARIEAVLDLADGKRELSSVHTCACGGTIVVYGGAGATPCARCKGCGALWTEQGIIVAA